MHGLKKRQESLLLQNIEISQNCNSDPILYKIKSPTQLSYTNTMPSPFSTFTVIPREDWTGTGRSGNTTNFLKNHTSTYIHTFECKQIWMFFNLLRFLLCFLFWTIHAASFGFGCILHFYVWRIFFHHFALLGNGKILSSHENNKTVMYVVFKNTQPVQKSQAHSSFQAVGMTSNLPDGYGVLGNNFSPKRKCHLFTEELGKCALCVTASHRINLFHSS